MSIALNLDHSTAVRPASASRPSLIGLGKPALAATLVEHGIASDKESRMRASQLWNWLYVNGVTDFDRMTNVAKPVRQKLADAFVLDRPEIVSEQVSVDGTRKWLFRFRDPANPNFPPVEVETVYIPEEDRGTLCVSSQVGCTLTCSFCHTGTQKLVRNLTAGEILGQILMARERLGDFPGGQRPAVAVARADMWAKAAIIMDEPTAALGARQTAMVYDAVRKAAERGLAVILVSHDIPKMIDFADRIAVMRHGTVVQQMPAHGLQLMDVLTTMLTAEGAPA